MGKYNIFRILCNNSTKTLYLGIQDKILNETTWHLGQFFSPRDFFPTVLLYFSPTHFWKEGLLVVRRGYSGLYPPRAWKYPRMETSGQPVSAWLFSQFFFMSFKFLFTLWLLSLILSLHTTVKRLALSSQHLPWKCLILPKPYSFSGWRSPVSLILSSQGECSTPSVRMASAELASIYQCLYYHTKWAQTGQSSITSSI